jgi:hypothetical protein
MTCSYCRHEATSRIPSNPGEVCPTHAIEFWTGLLAYAKLHPPVVDTPLSQCVASSPLASGISTRRRRSRSLAAGGGRPLIAGVHTRAPIVEISPGRALIAG